MARAPVCAVILLLSMWGLYHGGGALLPPRIVYYTRPAPNIALNGISNQSSTNFYFGNAQNAIDGSLAANYLRSQCSYTEKESEPWWMVDLKAPHRVISVAITNRVLECCRERLFGAEIRIGNNASNGGKLNPRCGVISSIESGETLLFSCKGMVGQYVTVTIPGREEHLVMCEVQVFGFPVDGSEDVAVSKGLKTPNGAPNVAPKGIAQQSSLYNMYGEPKNAIDGSLDSNYLYMQCAGTNEQKDPWWMVDLKSKYKIFTVAITNRGDCCAEKINGGQIRIGNSGDNGGIKNPICGVITSMGYGQTLAFECDGMVGQYVTVHIPGAERSLTICEVQVFGLPSDDAATSIKPETKPRKAFIHRPPESDNLAFRGITSQSSTYGHLGLSESAIDGYPNTVGASGRCTHTVWEKGPWWMVDLMNTFNVTKVKITNRVDCCWERINGAEIRIGDSPDNGGTLNPRCAKIESLGPGEEGEYVCGMVGQYVTITIPGRFEYLTLCEVKVYGTVAPVGYTGVNLASRGITSQSSTFNNLGASKNAIDGSSSAIYSTGHCTHTNLDVEPWWRVDLVNTFNVTKVKVTNRGCCCAERLNGAEIRIGNITEKGGTRNPTCAKIESLGRGKEGEYVCGMVGRYVTITIPGRAEYLTLCEVKVYGTIISEGYTATPIKLQTKPRKGVIRRPPESNNLASRGITSQSSTYDYLGASKNAIDGSPSAIYSTGHCTHTNLDVEPWWMLDLVSTFNVTKVKVTNRGCCCAERLNGAEIRIGNISENGGTQNPTCVKIESLGRGKEGEYICEMVGRYVTITIPGRAEYLTLCEVKVYGTMVSEGYAVTQLDADVPSGTNLVGRHFLFPKESITDYVVLTPAQPMRLNSFTLCMNLALNVSENRETILFTYRTLNHDALTLWQEYNGNVGFYMSGEGIMFPNLDKCKTWTHICLTWESKHGRCELWVNGRRTGNKIYRKKSSVQPGGTVILGQDYDSYNGDFDKKQSFVGKIKDLNMWNKVLSLRSLRSVFKGKVKQKGDIFDWSNLSYSIKGNVKLV